MSEIILPSRQHLEWAECELGVIIHQDIQCYCHGFHYEKLDELPPAEVFNPSSLDTDQWLKAASNFGAKYAVLVAKHCSGFSLWPTRAHSYSIASSSWRGGKGDVVADFIRSCEKYHIRPGLYASCGFNSRYRVLARQLADGWNREKWHQYVDMVKMQLSELWTNYGKLFEVWFDGGYLPDDMGGLDIVALLQKLQPDALAFQGNPDFQNCLRWCGTESALAPYPCWATSDNQTEEDGTVEYKYNPRFAGIPYGKYWLPAEADIPNRRPNLAYMHGWFWQPGEEHTLYPPELLLERYYSSVGRNCNFLLGMVVDDRGLVPDADFQQFTELGKLIRKQYARPVAKTSGEGTQFEIHLSDNEPVNMICIMENITFGERVLSYIVSGFDGTQWKTFDIGTCIGHKRLIKIPRAMCRTWRLVVTGHKKDCGPLIREFSVFRVE